MYKRVMLSNDKAGNARSVSHAYENSGTYTVSLKVIDDRGYTDTEARIGYIVVVGGWDVGTTVASARSGLMSFGRALVDFLVWLAFFSPIWIVAGGFFWWTIRRKRRKMSTASGGKNPD